MQHVHASREWQVNDAVVGVVKKHAVVNMETEVAGKTQEWLASAAQTITKARPTATIYASNRLLIVLLRVIPIVHSTLYHTQVLHLRTMATPDIGKLDLSDSDLDSEDLFASPSRASKPTQKSTKQTEPAPRKEESKYDAEQAREASLQRELESVRNINDVIEGVISSLDCAKGNMDGRSIPLSAIDTH
jgi:hypothetical protein